MERIQTFCGYSCGICRFYTKNIKSRKDKEQVSSEFNRIFGYDVKPEEVECAGCKNKGPHADTDCKVRPCALEKGVENCAHCSEFICDRLRTRIDFIENFLARNKKPLSEEDIEKYIKPYQNKDAMVKLNNEVKNER